MGTMVYSLVMGNAGFISSAVSIYMGTTYPNQNGKSDYRDYRSPTFDFVDTQNPEPLNPRPPKPRTPKPHTPTPLNP